MINHWRRPGLLTIILVVLTIGWAMAQSHQPDLQRHIISSGGNILAEGESYRLAGSVGEPIVNPVITTTNYHLRSGYWPGLFQQVDIIYLPVIKR